MSVKRALGVEQLLGKLERLARWEDEVVRDPLVAGRAAWQRPAQRVTWPGIASPPRRITITPARAGIASDGGARAGVARAGVTRDGGFQASGLGSGGARGLVVRGFAGRCPAGRRVLRARAHRSGSGSASQVRRVESNLSGCSSGRKCPAPSMMRHR